ncbi:MAG: eukaryotic-like serine/threonine-protein kinase [Acidobacteriota bacterium]|nr:eukaryotic-like serine/threonine-protein kinase [Acidobacteriota bacterium]
MNALEGGSCVGRYRIVKFLGAGAMGEVYLADDPQIDRQLAIKTVRLIGRPQEIDDRKKRLLREARAAGRLLHPHIVTLFDAGEAEGLLYLAFEYVEGTDLAVRLDSEAPRLSLREVLRVARQAAEALDYAHGQGIVHRDIKPSNILLDRAGRVKVADFGIAKMAGQSTELTMAGSVMGSPQYLSPEQIKGEDLDGRSDVFSLGVVIYEILSGKRPFEGDTITTLVYQILHKEPPPISELRAVPPRLEALMRRMLAKDPGERLAAGEAARELAVIETELSDETLSAPAGAALLEETFVLPRKPSTGAPVTPPPPFLSGVPPTRSTVPASPGTTPSKPPLPAPPAWQTPPVPIQPAASVKPAVDVPVAPPAPGSNRVAIGIVLAVGLLMLAAVGVGAWYAYTHWVKPRLQETVEISQTPQTPAQPEVTPMPVSSSSTSSSMPVSVTPQSAPAPRPAITPPVSTTPAPRPAVTPPPPAPEPRLRPEPTPAPPVNTEPLPAPAPSTPDESEPEPAAPSAPSADRTLRTGLEVAFHVTPPDAHVLVDGRVLGIAQDWSGQKGARTFTFPGPGTYLVKIRGDGMNELKIAVEASASAGITPIYANLRQRAAEQVDATDLRTVRVRQAVAFRGVPPMAAVLVDGQPMGLARRFGGGFMHPKEWLELPQGKHRVSIVAPGHRRRDILVDVSPTADKDRERIDVVLTQGGDGD